MNRFRGEVVRQQWAATGWYLPSLDAYHATHGYPATLPMVNRYWTVPDARSPLEQMLARVNARVRALRRSVTT